MKCEMKNEKSFTIHHPLFTINYPPSTRLMNIIKTDIPDVLIIEPKVFGDARGYFHESFNQKTWQEKTGIDAVFVQDNHSRSEKNVYCAACTIKFNNRRENWFGSRALQNCIKWTKTSFSRKRESSNINSFLDSLFQEE